MFAKLSFLLLTVPFVSYSSETPINLHYIGINGTVTMTDLYEQIPITFKDATYNYFSDVYIDIYVDNKKEIDSFIINSRNLGNKTFYINGFDSINQSKKIKIVVGYVNYKNHISYINFTLSGPSYNTIILNSYSIPVYKPINPFKIDFYMKKDSYEIYPVYETIFCYNNINNVVNNTRYFDFSNIKFIINSPLPYKLSFCELRIYYKDEKSDLIYREEGYMCTDIAIKTNVSNNYEVFYNLVNEYKYYVNEENGSINENYIDGCNEDVLPFFFPFYMGFDKTYKYEIVFYDVGYNHNDYVIQGEVTLSSNKNIEDCYGGVLNYQYVEVNNELENINYE